MTIGIYQISNKSNGKRYIGSSNNIELRIYHHKNLLRKNAHPNRYLQASWNKNGESAFYCSIIEKVDKEDNLIDRETHYFLLYGVLKNKSFYNILGFARRCKGNRSPLKDSHKTKISLGLKMFYVSNGGSSKRGKKYKHIKRIQSIYTRQKIRNRLVSFYQNNNNPNKGRIHSKEFGEKISQKLKEGYASGKIINPFLNKKHTEASKILMGEKHRGVVVSQATRNKISAAFKGENHPLYGKFGADNPKFIKLGTELEDYILNLYTIHKLPISQICSVVNLKRWVISRTLHKKGIKIECRNQYSSIKKEDLYEDR